MGTRHLIAVQIDNEYKIAQYGQWDGYFSGQGATVYEFLKGMDKEKFVAALRASSAITEDEYKQAWVDCGADPESDFVSMDVSRKFTETYHHLSRDTGANILQLVQDSYPNGLKLNLNIEFAGSSLFCEYAYVIDFDKNVLEIYRGFNKTPLDESERFSQINCEDSSYGYHQIRLFHSWPLDDLPESVEDYVAFLGKKLEAENDNS